MQPKHPLTSRSPRLVGAAAALALHAAVLGAILAYAPARSALLAAAPIMVEFLVPVRAEPPKPEPRVEPPRPKPVRKQVVRKAEPPPVLSTPAEVPAPSVVAPPPPPQPEPQAVVAAPAPAPLPLTEPVYDANYLDNPAPPYPTPSRRSGEQGRVILRVLVNPRGMADEVEVRRSSGYVRLDDSARATVRRWKFVPAKRGTEPVAAWVLIPISFRLEG